MIITPEIEKSIPYQYALDVRAGKIVTGELIKLSVKRFFDWIETADADGFYLDFQSGMAPIRFFENYLNHTKGHFAGQPFVLAPFQQFTMFNVFGWMNPRGLRRINTVYDKRAKKNGKTAEMAGVGLYCMSFDLEHEAEIYIGATKEDQAKLCSVQAKNFIDSPLANPTLRNIGFYTRQKDVCFLHTNSFLRPLGGDSKTQDGIASHISIIDEYHAHVNDDVKENLESSAVLRAQPITWHITTAGFNKAGVCKAYEDMCIDVLKGKKIDNHLWVMIHNLDKNDDWEDQNTWFKANPLLGQGLKIESLQREYIKAVNQLSKQPNFKTKHLNLWVDAADVWIPQYVWDKNKVDKIPIKKFKKYGNFAAIDLSTTTDITAHLVVSKADKKGNHYVIPTFFCPKETIEKKTKTDRVPYKTWVAQGHIIATEGNTTDYNIVQKHVEKSFFKLKTERVEMDQWNANQMCNNLQANEVIVSYFSQAIGIISAPTKLFEKLLYEGKLKHDGNPVLEWMLSGCIIYRDANDNIKVHKGKSNQGVKRVDGIVCEIMCIGAIYPKDEEKPSKYKTMEVEDLEPEEMEP